MLPVLIAAALWLPALIGLGSPLVSALRRASGAIACSIALRTAITGLLGMFIASTITAAVNFFVTVYPWVSTALLLVGWLLLIPQRRRWLRLPRSSWRLCFMIFAIVALIDARGLPWYDTGLYHLQAVQWMTTGPLPQGLANLHDRLGFNCAWFCLAAAVEIPLALGKSCFIVNTLLAILIALPAVDVLLRTSRSGIRPDRVLLALMLIPLAIYGLDQAMISSLSPDLIVMLLVMLSIALWLRSPRFVPQILTLACFALTIKLSAAPLLLIALLFCIAGSRRWGMLPAAFCVLAGVISLTRGIWLSGYPAFPSTLGRLPNLSWTSPPELAQHAAEGIEQWSKYPPIVSQAKPGGPWMADWMAHNSRTHPMLIAFALCAGGMLICIGRQPRFRAVTVRGLLALITLFLALVFWFVTAPQLRFGYGWIISTAALPAALGLDGFILPAVINRTRKAITTSAILMLLLCFRIDRHILKTALLHWPAIPTANLTPDHRIAGTTIWIPLNDDRAWNAPIPTTPQLNPLLRCDITTQGRILRFRIDPPK